MKIEINVNIRNYKAIDAYVRKEFGKTLKQLIEQEVDVLVENAAEQVALRQEIVINIQGYLIKSIGTGEVKIPSSALKWEKKDDETNKTS